MDVSRFLSSGTTYAHTSQSGVLAKVGAAVVMSLALAAGAQADGRVSQVTDLVPPQDMISTFYQSVAAPGSDKLVVVSAQSAELNRILASMPTAFAKQLQARADATHSTADAAGFLRAVQRDPEAAFTYRLNGSTLFGDQQTLCFVNAVEAVYQQTLVTQAGTEYFAIKTPGSLESIHTADDAMYMTTIHELYHCAADQMYGNLAQKSMGQAGAYYGGAVDEMLADLAVVMSHAATDGNFTNGMATVRGMRAPGLGDLEHNAEDMLEYVVDRLDASQMQGMTTPQIMAVVNQIASELDPLHNQTLKDLYAVSAAEKAELANRVFGPNEQRTDDVTAIASGLDADITDANPTARAHKVLDALITLNVKNAVLQRQLGASGVDDMSRLAETMGAIMPAYQQARAATFDASIAQGQTVTSPWPADESLKVGDRFGKLFSAHAQRMEAQQQLQPTVGLR